MNRRDVMRAAGRLPWPPTEQMWEELERELAAHVAAGPGYATTAELLNQQPARTIVFQWKRRYKLMAEDQPPSL